MDYIKELEKKLSKEDIEIAKSENCLEQCNQLQKDIENEIFNNPKSEIYQDQTTYDNFINYINNIKLLNTKYHEKEKTTDSILDNLVAKKNVDKPKKQPKVNIQKFPETQQKYLDVFDKMMNGFYDEVYNRYEKEINNFNKDLNAYKEKHKNDLFRTYESRTELDNIYANYSKDVSDGLTLEKVKSSLENYEKTKREELLKIINADEKTIKDFFKKIYSSFKL